MDNYNFAYPWVLVLLLAIPFLFIYKWKKIKSQNTTITISTIQGFKGQKSLLAKLKPFLFLLPLTALALIIVAMARPRSIDAQDVEGIDILVTMDVSSSLLATDFKPNRLSALKDAAIKFVQNRPNDRIGLIIYAGEAYTRVPLTTDKVVLENAIREINFNNVIDDGTAIGMGLATAINRLKESDTKSKVIILLTDGVNNTGNVEPETAAEAASQYGLKVYSIGVGSKGTANFPERILPTGDTLYSQKPVEIDEQLLKNIALKTRGKYFRATDNEKLNKIYNEINQLEKTKIEDFSPTSYIEEFRNLVVLAMLLLLGYFALDKTLFKGIV